MAKEYIEPMKPIIEQIMSNIRTQQEDAIMRAVCDCGIVVDKERLVQALTDARAFYEEGYRAAMNAADVVEVVRGYHEGDVCIYGFGNENKSRAIVEIVRILNDERGVAEVKFHKVFVDDTGNGFFSYLLKSGRTMNASFQYLKNITPRMDGDNDGNKENL